MKEFFVGRIAQVSSQKQIGAKGDDSTAMMFFFIGPIFILG
jgi:hypothetical protein